MRLLNFTKHPLRLHARDGAVVELPPDPRHLGVVALGDHATATDAAGHVFSLNTRTVTEVKNLPAPEPGVLLIVPVEVAMALQAHRPDLFFPAEEADVRGLDGAMHRVTHLRRIVSRMAPAG